MHAAIFLRPLARLLLFLALSWAAVAALAITPDELTLIARAAERGSASAQLMLALAYLNGDGGLSKDAPRAARWFEAAALAGNGYAEERLGDLYAQGIGVPPNARLAADWREKAANRGIVAAQVKLGKMYLEGQGLARDSAKAHYWIQRAAIEGNAEAQFLLGQMYHAGTALEANPALAHSWFEKAALQGYESAIQLLHLIENIGYQLEESWYHRLPGLRKLAEDGDSEAQYQLAQRYEHGVGGVDRDLQVARNWYTRAAAGGNSQARQALEELRAQPRHGEE